MAIGIHFNASQRHDRGTYKVASNLIIGLKRSGKPYLINPTSRECTLHGFLQGNGWAYFQKLSGKQYLWGPNIVVLPSEAPWCFGENQRHVTPCHWVYNQYKADPCCKANITIWPVGIDTDYFNGYRDEQKDCLIYFKDVTRQRSTHEIEVAKGVLNSHRQTYTVMQYGNYREEDFIKACKEHRYMLVLSGTESQFIALLEAYSLNIPAYILDMREMLWAGKTYKNGGFTSAPYTDERCGIVATDYSRFTEFLNGAYSPREYVIENFTLEKCAIDYYNIITSV